MKNLKGKQMMRSLLLVAVLLIGVKGEQLSLREFEGRVVKKGYHKQVDSLDDVARSWQKKNVIAGYLPDISLNGSVVRLSKEAQLGQLGALSSFPGITVDDATLISYDITLNQPLTNGGIEIVAIKIASLTKRAQEIGYEINRDQAIVSARKRYFDLLKLEEQIKLAESDLSWDREKLREAKIRFESSVLPETDLLQWQSSVLQKESTLETLKSLRAAHYANLKLSMGEEYTTGDSFEIEPFENFEEWYRSVELQSLTLSKSKLLTQMELYDKVTEKSSTAALTSALPKLNGFVSYKRSRYSEDDSYTGGLQGGLQLSVPLFSGFRNLTSYREKKHESIQSKVELEKLKAELMVSAVQLRSYCESAKGTIESIKKQWALNEKNVTIMNDRYLHGQVSQSDLISMRNALSLTRLEYVTNILDMLYYYTEYQSLLGLLEVK